jgi:hypothetical protein
MSTSRALLLDVFLSSSTRNDKRPEDERHLSYDVSSFNQLEFTLSPNTLQGDNPASVKAIGKISQFVHFYTPYTLELTMGGLVIPTFKKLLVLSGSIDSFSLRNLAMDRSVTCNIVYA